MAEKDNIYIEFEEQLWDAACVICSQTDLWIHCLSKIAFSAPFYL